MPKPKKSVPKESNIPRLTILVDDADQFKDAFQRFTSASRNADEALCRNDDEDAYRAFHGHKIVKEAAAEDMANLILGIEIE